LLLCALLSACVPGAPGTAGDPVPQNGRLRTLVLMLDGVPFPVLDSLYNAGHFRGFRRPSMVISPFPSLTGVAFREVWGAPPSAGYEDRYYDAERNRVTGGALEHFLGDASSPTFHDNVHIEANGLLAGLIYIWPDALAQLEMRDLRRRVLESARRDTTVVAYLVSTDAIAHRSGRARLVDAVLEVEKLTDEVRALHGPDVRIHLFSDHGNDLVPTRGVRLDSALTAAGFHAAQRIEKERDVVLPRFGLVGSAFLYSAPAAEPAVAEALVGVRGVDLVLFDDSAGRVHVWNREGRATVTADSARTWFRYDVASGDPLALLPALRRLQAAGIADANGTAPDSAWLRESIGTPYIDSLRRIITGMRASVRNPASVVVSFAPGYHYGDLLADRFVNVTGTHGSLRTTSSAAFFLTTGDVPPPMLRADQVLQYAR
jgi:hypothetical protein